VKNFHYSEVREDDSKTTGPLARHHRESGDKQHERCGLLPEGPNKTILFLYLAALDQKEQQPCTGGFLFLLTKAPLLQFLL
jgi:hypothetical protein